MLEETCNVDGQSLALNGVGHRRIFMVNVYVARLYTAAKVSSIDELKASTAPIRIFFEYLYGPISRDRIVGAWKSALVATDYERVAAHLDTFLETITDYQKGDTVHYDILPGGELRVYKNGQHALTLKSRPFCDAVLNVMFGPTPIDKNLKAGLLALDEAVPAN